MRKTKLIIGKAIKQQEIYTHASIIIVAFKWHMRL